MTVTARHIAVWLAASGLGLDIRLLGGWGTRASKPRGCIFARVPAETLGALSERRLPGFGKGRFTGVKDELTAMLASV